MLEARLLVYIDEVVKAGSIRKAAERLHVSASSINRQILALEERLGTPLFQRLPRKMVLTAAGEVLIHHVRRSRKELEWAQLKIEELKGLQRGEVTIAIMSGLAANLVPELAAQFHRANPHVKLLLRQMSTGEDILNAVANGDADLGLGFDFTASSALRTLAEVTVRLGAVVAPIHPLAGRTSLRISDCISHPLILADRSTVIRRHLDTLFEKASVPVMPIIETNSIEVMRHTTMTDNGLSFLTPVDIDYDRRAGRLIYIPVKELGFETQRLMLLGHTRGSSAVASVLSEMLKGMMHQFAQ